jgi:hypothetical protein
MKIKLEATNRLHEGLNNAIQQIGDKVKNLAKYGIELKEFLENSCEIFDDFIRERIVGA